MRTCVLGIGMRDTAISYLDAHSMPEATGAPPPPEQYTRSTGVLMGLVRVIAGLGQSLRSLSKELLVR